MKYKNNYLIKRRLISMMELPKQLQTIAKSIPVSEPKAIVRAADIAKQVKDRYGFTHGKGKSKKSKKRKGKK